MTNKERITNTIAQWLTRTNKDISRANAESLFKFITNRNFNDIEYYSEFITNSIYEKLQLPYRIGDLTLTSYESVITELKKEYIAGINDDTHFYLNISFETFSKNRIRENFVKEQLILDNTIYLLKESDF